MGQVIDFERAGVAQLQRRVAAAEEDRSDLVALAHGYTGATAAIHSAVLAAMEAADFEDLLDVVTLDWPDLLGIDMASLALCIGNRAILVDGEAVSDVEAKIVAGATKDFGSVVLRDCAHGHPLFGGAAETVRSEALVAIGDPATGPYGILLLGQTRQQALVTQHGAELLTFLGDSLERLIVRWLLS